MSTANVIALIVLAAAAGILLIGSGSHGPRIR